MPDATKPSEPVPATSIDPGLSAPGSDLPPGNHPLEVAARRGIGPLSSACSQIWHGHARPCVTCGQLVPRDAAACDHCAQDLSEAMLAKMAAHAGPWYVLEHVRPFPGVTLDRIIRQIRRGLITETSIVRGPSSDYQWRFAVETPGLCRYFSKCWHCQEAVSPSDTYCQHCLSNLSFEQGSPAESPAAPTGAPGQHPARPNDRRPLPAGRSGSASTEASRVNGGAPPQVAEPSSAPLTELSAALGQADLPHHEPIWDDPPRIGGLRATWVAAILVAIVIVVLLFITQSRSVNLAPPPIPGTILLEV